MRRRPLRREDDGQIAVLSALLVVVLFGLGALAVDLGNMQARKRTTQTTADLAALAGAQGLPDAALARTYALDYLLKNPVAGEAYATCPACYSDNDRPDYANGEIIVTDSMGNAVTSGTDGKKIRVIVPRRTVNFGLANVMGFTSGTVHAAATATVGSPAKGKILPFGVAATAGGGGLYCIHDNTNGQNDAITSALLAPRIGLAPTAVSTAGGDTVAVTGSATNFQKNRSDVYFDGVLVVAATVTDATNATFVTPAHAAGSVQVKIVTKITGQTTETAGPATLTYATPAPTVTSVSPNSGPAGTTVTITGSGFASGATVTFGPTSASAVTFDSATQLTATAPTGSATVDVVVTVADKSSATTSADRYSYAAPPPPPPAPTVTNVNPNSGKPGDTVTVTGTGFSPGTVSVAFGANAATGVTVTSSTSLTAVAPTGTGTVDVIVTVAGTPSAVSAADQFTYLVDPCVSATGNFGYLNFRGYTPPKTLEQNIILGAKYTPDIFPTALLPPLNTKCVSNGNPTRAILDNGTDNSYNCVRVQNGQSVLSATQALLDGINNPKLDPRLLNPSAPPCSMGTVKGRSNIENDSLANFLTVPLSTFVNNINGTPTAGVVKKEIYNCPRFFLVPVLQISGNQPNGFYPILRFMGAFIEDFETTAIKAYVFSLDWIASPGASGGTIPFVGSGPRIPILVHDPYDLPH